jgi:hypothetical protein
MNERIKELAEQVYGSAHYDDFKFAELIIRECGEYLMRPEFIGRSDLDWSMVLKEHFRVE